MYPYMGKAQVIKSRWQGSAPHLSLANSNCDEKPKERKSKDMHCMYLPRICMYLPCITIDVEFSSTSPILLSWRSSGVGM